MEKNYKDFTNEEKKEYRIRKAYLDTCKSLKNVEAKEISAYQIVYNGYNVTGTTKDDAKKKLIEVILQGMNEKDPDFKGFEPEEKEVWELNKEENEKKKVKKIDVDLKEETLKELPNLNKKSMYYTEWKKEQQEKKKKKN